MSAPASGVAVLVAVALGLGLAVYAISRDALVLIVWALGATMIYRAAKAGPKSVQDAPDPAPPTPPERGSKTEPQVNIVRDTAHPNRWIVTRESPWLTYRHESRDES